MKVLTLLVALGLAGPVAAGQPFGPYNQQYTFNQNQQYGATNWYSSPLGMGAAQMGVTLIGGLVNAMSRPDPVITLPPTVVQVPASTAPVARTASPMPMNCSMQTLYDQQGQPRYVKVCD